MSVLRGIMIIFSVGAVWLALLVWAPASASVEDRHVGSIDDFVIQQLDGDGRARVVALHDIAPGCLVNRLLLVSPDGRPLIVTDTLDPGRGTLTAVLLDDETGWWAALRTDLQAQASSYRQLFDLTREHSWDTVLPVTFTTSEGLSLAATCAQSPSGHEELLAKFLSMDLAEQLIKDLPAGLAEAVLFLDGISAIGPSPEAQADSPPISSSWRPLIQLLAGALRAGAPAKEAPGTWTVREKRSRAGFSLHEPELLEFAAQFRSVGLTDPLAGRRSEDPFQGCQGERPEPGSPIPGQATP